MPTTNQFFWYELMTSDHEAAQSFYTKVVGWTTRAAPADGHPYTELEAQGRGVGGIMPIPPEAAQHGIQPSWSGYIHVADIEVAVAKIGAEGGTIHRAPDMIPNVGRFAVVADPQGAMFNILQPDGPEMPPLPVDANGVTDWHELHGSDRETALRFYQSVFGWSATGDMDMGPLGKYQFFAMEPAPEGAECGTTCGAMYNDPDASHPYWLFYFHVEAIDAAIERITANDGKIVQDAHEVPGGMWIVNARDPQGATFALVAPKR